MMCIKFFQIGFLSVFLLFLTGCRTEPRVVSEPKFQNGDLVRYRLNPDIRGMVINNSIRYDKEVCAWVTEIDFLNGRWEWLKKRPYKGITSNEVYEFELDLVRSMKADYRPARWEDKCFLEKAVIIEYQKDCEL